MSIIRFYCFIFLFSYTSQVQKSSQLREQFYRQMKKGYYMPSHCINSNHSVSSSLECGHFCLGDDKCSGFNYKSKKENKERNCQLTNCAAKDTVITNDKAWEFYQTLEECGTKEFPGKSCGDILTKTFSHDILDGIYWISLNSTISGAFPVFCDMKNGGWTLIFKGIAGVSGVISSIWQSSFSSNEFVLDALNIENNFKGHYKNRIVQEWRRFNPTQARIVLYSGRKEDLVLTFNAQNTNSSSWFAEGNLLTSPWQDIHDVTDKNFFSVVGTCSVLKCRDFHINAHYNSCPDDVGWLTIGNLDVCDWETRHGATSFLYSKTTVSVNWNNIADVGASEVFAVYLR